MTYFHTTKFGFNRPSNNGNKEGDGIPPYLVDFSDPIPLRVNVRLQDFKGTSLPITYSFCKNHPGTIEVNASLAAFDRQFNIGFMKNDVATFKVAGSLKRRKPQNQKHRSLRLTYFS